MFHYSNILSCILLQYFLSIANAINVPTNVLSAHPTCSLNTFQCADGQCIPYLWRCNYDINCDDGSDEVGCPTPNCTKDEIPCDNYRCVPKRYVCDGDNDCDDGTDEKDCPNGFSCKSDQFKCLGDHGRDICVFNFWRCNLERECKDGSDEINCSVYETCPKHEYSCASPAYFCIYASWVCDGEIDCPNGVDERNCMYNANPNFPLQNQILPKDKACDTWLFTCNNKKCLPYWLKCNGNDDCGDNSDEVNCLTLTSSTPGSPHQRCSNTQLFKCTNGNCIHSSLVCNEDDDCLDGSDEINCPEKINGCPLGYFRCDRNICRPLSSQCDGKRDCFDGLDERNCHTFTRSYQVRYMGVDEQRNSILLNWWIPIPNDKLKLEFLPCISKIGENDFENKTWIQQTEYLFTDLSPSNKYNLTVYVRLSGSQIEFSPLLYLIAETHS